MKAGDDVDQHIQTIGSHPTKIIFTWRQSQSKAVIQIYALACSTTVRCFFFATQGGVAGNGHHLASQPAPICSPNFLIDCATAS